MKILKFIMSYNTPYHVSVSMSHTTRSPKSLCDHHITASFNKQGLILTLFFLFFSLFLSCPSLSLPLFNFPLPFLFWAGPFPGFFLYSPPLYINCIDQKLGEPPGNLFYSVWKDALAYITDRCEARESNILENPKR